MSTRKRKVISQGVDKTGAKLAAIWNPGGQATLSWDALPQIWEDTVKLFVAPVAAATPSK